MKPESIRLILLALLPAAIGSCRPDVGAQLSPRKGEKDVCPDTRLTLTFPVAPVLGTEGKIRITDCATGEVVDSLDMSIPAGPTEPRDYPPDCDYTKVPYDYSRSFVPTNRTTQPGTPSGTAERTPADYQLNIIGGFTDAFHFHPVLIRENKAVVCLHNNVLEYGHTYAVSMEAGVLTCPESNFDGISPRDNWTFSIKEQAAQAVTADTIVVDAGGNGDFCTVQGALDAVPDFKSRQTTILIRQGDYEEIVYARNKSNVVLKGEGKDLVRVHYANNEVFNPHPLKVKTNEWPGTFPSRRAAFMLDNCSDIILEDFTVATDLQGQAEGLLLNGERILLHRLHIIGSGDALQANGTICMAECELDGGGDTILGRGSLFAWRSHFRNDGGPFTWVRNTEGHHGDIFVECILEGRDGRMADYGRTKTNHGSTYPFAEQVLIDCKVLNIIPEGWSNIGCQSAVMLEYGTVDLETGLPADVSRRHPWSRQLQMPADSALVSSYRNPAFVLDGWNPFEGYFRSGEK